MKCYRRSRLTNACVYNFKNLCKNMTEPKMTPFSHLKFKISDQFLFTVTGTNITWNTKHSNRKKETEVNLHLGIQMFCQVNNQHGSSVFVTIKVKFTVQIHRQSVSVNVNLMLCYIQWLKGSQVPGHIRIEYITAYNNIQTACLTIQSNDRKHEDRSKGALRQTKVWSGEQLVN